jgi:hypothetical protein
MTEVLSGFIEEIEANKAAETAPDIESVLKLENSVLSLRNRGCFITELQLTQPGTDKVVTVLHSQPEKNVPKLVASHIMSPVGPSEGPGGQHGFPRWADYKEFALDDGPDGQKRTALQAKRSDNGLDVAKSFELSGSQLRSETTIYNPSDADEQTSIGEHLYFKLVNEEFAGITLNGRSLDEILGAGTEEGIKVGGAYFWEGFDGEVIIGFPAGHRVLLTAQASDGQLGMLFWHREGSESICFEPTVGFNKKDGNNGLILPAYSGATLSTSLELL